MKMNAKFYGLALGALVGGMLASCTNELNEPTFGPVDGNGTVNLVHAPDVIAWSGEYGNLGNTFDGTRSSFGTRGVDVNVNQWAEKYECKNATKTLSSEDIDAIKGLLSKSGPTTNSTTIPYANYFVQQVYKGESTYHASDKDGTPTNTEVTGSNQMDYLVALGKNGYEHINNFNYGSNTNNASCSLHNHLGTTLMTNMPTEGVDPNKQFGYHETWGTMNKERYEYHYLIVQYKGDYYVGFDYHAETDRQNSGEASKVDRDWKFTDWIVRISPADPIGETPEQPEETCGECGHTSHGDTCAECGPDTGCNKKEDSGNTGGGNNGNGGNQGGVTGGDEEKTCDCGGDAGKCTCGDKCGCPDCKIRHNDEVEVNYALLDSHDPDQTHDDYGYKMRSDIADLITKLSIHVRYPHDVQIRIPVPTKYVVESDDLYIFNEHYTGGYNGTTVSPNENGILENEDVIYSYKINEQPVTLTVEFKNDEIIVTTHGINKTVFDYCWNNFGDGLNFEIYNYFQTEKWNWVSTGKGQDVYVDEEGNETDKGGHGEVTQVHTDLNAAKLKECMDGATIYFIDGVRPKYYINAFGNKVNSVWTDTDDEIGHTNTNTNLNEQNPNHATVQPGEGYKDYNHVEENRYHLNGNSFNVIYYYTTEPDDAHIHGQNCYSGPHTHSWVKNN